MTLPRTALIAALLALPLVAQAADTEVLTYQGRLTDPASGDPVEGDVAMTARLFAAADGGDALCVEPHDAVAVADGRFRLTIGGAGCDDLATLFGDNPTAFLELTVDGETLAPRVALSPVGYALRSKNAGHAETADYAAVAGYAEAQEIVVGEGASERRYSVNGVFRGTTSQLVDALGAPIGSFDAEGRTAGAITFPSADGGELVGNAAAKAACEAALGSPTAHLCGPEEIVRSDQLGLWAVIPEGPGDWPWYGSGTWSRSEQDVEGEFIYNDDCNSWRIDSVAQSGARWFGLLRTPRAVTWDPCEEAHPIACCDHPE